MKKLRKLALIAMIPILVLSVFSVKFIFTGKKAFAAGTNAFDQIFSVNGGYVAQGEGVDSGWKTEYELDDTFTPYIPAGTTLFIYNPNGDVLEEMEAGHAIPVEFDMPGYYTAVYKATDGGIDGKPAKLIPVTREFRFNVVADDYQLELIHSDPAMRTLVAKGAKFSIPRAQVIWTDKKDEVQVLKSGGKPVNVWVRISDTDHPDGVSSEYVYDGGAKEITAPTKGGKIFITYYYGGVAGSKSKATIQKDFVVTVTDESSINKNLKPTLNVSGMTTAYPLMSKVTLPVATASDEQDKNVKIEITAKITASDSTESTKLYTVKDELLDKDMFDDKKYSGSYFIDDKYKDPSKPDFYATNPDNEVDFDNNRNKTFYPHVAGTYVITYTATNQVGHTDKVDFKFTVEDTTNPYIKVKSTEIPKKWSASKITILEKDANGISIEKTNENKGDLTLRLPRPDFVDNFSLEGKLLPNAKVIITRGGQSAEVERLEYDGEGKPFKSTNGKVVDEGAGGYLTIAKSVLADWAGSDINVKYSVSDEKGKYSELNFAIQILTNEFKDLYKPAIDIKGVNTVKLGGKLLKPSIDVNDGEGALTWETKYILSNRDVTEAHDAYINGVDEDITILPGGGKFEDLFYKDAIEKFNLGLFGFVNGDYSKLLVLVTATDAVGNVAKDFKKIEIIDILTETKAPDIQSVYVTGNPADGGDEAYLASDPSAIDTDLNHLTGIVYDTTDYPIEISDIVVYQEGKDVYVGYEFTIRNSNGEIVGTSTDTTSWIDTWSCDMVGSPVYHAVNKTTVLHIQNFKFKPDSKGIYTITLSVFNVSGATSSINFTVKVVPSIGFGGRAADVVREIPATLEYGKIVDLPNYRVTTPDGEFVNIFEEEGAGNYIYKELFYKRLVTGPHYSIQGFELWAFKKDSYTVTYFCDGKLNGKNVNIPSYQHEIKVDDTVLPVIKLTGVMPTVSIDVDQRVYLPGMAASDAAGIDKEAMAAFESLTESIVSVRNGETSEPAKNVDKVYIDKLEAEIDDLTANDPTNPRLEKAKAEFAIVDGNVGMYYFDPFPNNSKKDGKYEITYKVVDNNGKQATARFIIEIGDVYVPVITLSGGGEYKDYKKNANFRFLDFYCEDLYYEKTDGKFELVTDKSDTLQGKVVITLTAPDGVQAHKFENQRSNYKPKNQDTVKLDKVGEYKVTYSVTDNAGNEGTLNFTFKVTEKNKAVPINNKVLAVILVVAGVLVIAGVVFYFVRYRKKVQ